MGAFDYTEGHAIKWSYVEKNRTFLDKFGCLRLTSGLLKRILVEALSIVKHITNQIPCSAIDEFFLQKMKKRRALI